MDLARKLAQRGSSSPVAALMVRVSSFVLARELLVTADLCLSPRADKLLFPKLSRSLKHSEEFLKSSPVGVTERYSGELIAACDKTR